MKVLSFVPPGFSGDARGGGRAVVDEVLVDAAEGAGERKPPECW